MSLLNIRKKSSFEIITASTSINAAEVFTQVSKLVDIFTEFGIKRLAFLAANSPGTVIVELACMKANITLIPIPLFFSGDQTRHSLEECKADFILSDRDRSGYGEIYRIINTSYYNFGLFKTVFKATPCEGISHITFTSGTTAAPKGVLLTKRVLEERVKALNERIGGCQEDVFLSFMPFSILLETVTGIYLPLFNGAKTWILNGIEAPLTDPGTVYNYLTVSQATVTVMMPHMVDALSKYIIENKLTCPEKLRFIGAGGAKISSTSLELAEKAGLPVYQGYGLSEAGSVVCLNNKYDNRPGAVGKTLDGIEVRILEDEIQVKGAFSPGYTTSSCNYTGDGWLKTGDCGFLDEDGFLYINGRKNNVINTSNGRNISPEWIESELNAFAEIDVSFVIGEGRLNPVAFCAFRSTDCPAEVLRIINKKLPSYANLADIVPVDKKLLTEGEAVSPNGRFKRKELEQLILKQSKYDELYHEWI